MNIFSPTKIAVIDIGSNTIRLQVSDVLEKTYRVAEEYKDLTKLGELVFRSGRFNEEAFKRLDRALSEINLIIKKHSPEHIRAVATASFREAENFQEAVDFIKEKHGIEIEVIDGKTEAELTFLAVSSSFQLNKYRALIVDIGGGSTEFIVSDFGEIEQIDSLKIGCTIMTDMFLKSDPPTDDEYNALKEHLKKQLHTVDLDGSIDILICTGGSMNNLAVVHHIQKGLDANMPVKYVDRKFLKTTLQTLRTSSIEERASMTGIEPKRADNIIPAPAQIDAILEACHCGGFFTLNGGLRTGLTVDTLNKLGIELPFQQGENDDVRYSRLLDIGNKFYFEEEHSVHVEKLALILFESLKDIMRLPDSDKKILQAAAVLHDIGQYISYSKHHKHSYYLIQNSQLLSYSRKEVAVIANIARYHRKSPPKPKHAEFMELDDVDQDRVLKLSAILRVADALDRSHTSKIQSLEVQIRGKEIKLTTDYKGDLSIERRKLQDKADLMKKMTGRDVVLL